MFSTRYKGTNYGEFFIYDNKELNEDGLLFYLPADTVCQLEGDKVIAENKILDGGYVYERISIKPYQLSFDFTIRQQQEKTQSKFKAALGNKLKKAGIDPMAVLEYVFPQIEIQALANTYIVDDVVYIENTYLNALGIDEIIIRSITITPQRGTTDVIGTIKAVESPKGDMTEIINA